MFFPVYRMYNIYAVALDSILYLDSALYLYILGLKEKQTRSTFFSFLWIICLHLVDIVFNIGFSSLKPLFCFQKLKYIYSENDVKMSKFSASIGII